MERCSQPGPCGSQPPQHWGVPCTLVGEQGLLQVCKHLQQCLNASSGLPRTQTLLLPPKSAVGPDLEHQNKCHPQKAGSTPGDPASSAQRRKVQGWRLITHSSERIHYNDVFPSR